MVIFKGCIFREWALIFHFINGFNGPYLSNTCEAFQDFIIIISRMEPLLAKFLKYKSLENFHLYGISMCIAKKEKMHQFSFERNTLLAP